jgi:hypothetical protein
MVLISAELPVILSELFRGFAHFLQAFSGTVHILDYNAFLPKFFHS